MTQKNIQAIPVVRASAHDYELAALVGDDAVILGWTMADSIDRSDLLGFAIKRTCRRGASGREAECRWLPNHRRFAARGAVQDDSPASTQSDPLQQFYFLDYAVESGCTYSYSVVPVRGTPALRYFEAPVSVTVHPRRPWPDAHGARGATAETAPCGGSRRGALLPGPAARQQFRSMSQRELACEVQRLTDQARSAVFLYSTVELPDAVIRVVREVNSGRLLYGLIRGRDDELLDARRAHNTVHLSRPVTGQRLEPLRMYLHGAGGADAVSYTSALVTDPWSRSPAILLWSDVASASADALVETRLVSRDKRCAARLATSIFQAYTAGRLPARGDRCGGAGGCERRLEPDGRWSNIYFSRHAPSHKFREREIFSGHP